MQGVVCCILGWVPLVLAGPAAEPGPPAGARLTPVPIQQVTIDDAFWSPRLHTWRSVTLPDCLAKFERDGTLLNFDRVRDGKLNEPHSGPPWYDGLLYEMIRAGADFLAAKRDPALERRLDGYIERIAAAQARTPDGYLNTYTQMREPTHRWGLNGGNDNLQHDVYNAGMLVEAAVHYYRATGKTGLLKVAVRLANHMADLIGPAPKKAVIPGHSGPEEALVRLVELFRAQPGLKETLGVPVDERNYLRLAEYFIEARGHHEGRKSFGSYGQDHKPVFQQDTLEGHAVRATLMGTGLAALSVVNGREDYRRAAVRLWDNMTTRRMHVTGGVGSSREGEAFSRDYDLPNDGYLETCAAIGSGFYSRNLNLAVGEARYADELERTLYNAVLAGVSLQGDRYFYENPLEGRKNRARWAWHGCPCCPPMFLKMVAALPGYLYAQDTSGIYVNLFVGSRAEVRLPSGKVVLRQTTRYPWHGEVKIAVDPETPGEFDLSLRIPAWCQGPSSENDLYRVDGRPAQGGFRLAVNGKAIDSIALVRGYARVRRQWKAGDVVEMVMDMPVRRVKAHPRVKADVNRVALMRGPIVYCVEGRDHGGTVRPLLLRRQAPLTAEHRPDLLGGVTVVRGRATALYRTATGGVEEKPTELVAIPYAVNANRGPAEMRVWLPESRDGAQPVPVPTVASRATPSASHCCPTDDVHALNDQVEPTASDDTKIPRFTWWDHRGTKEWVQYDLDEARTVTGVAVYWWDERRIKAHCRVPQSWRLLYRDGEQWKPVAGASGYGTNMDRFNRVT
ncbi:MAG: glycoside hydrolase family 127 protein, partial [Gemmataceae bacterium]